MDRLTKLLTGLDLAGGAGLEIAALRSPILRRPDARVAYVDYLDTARLREKYAADPDVDADAIVEVDIVWQGERLGDLVGDRRFDHVVASHVCEHVPDLVWWLSELRAVLRPYGSVRLIVPDKRYTFDHRRRESTVGDVLAAFVERRARPGPREILDFWLGYLAVDRAAAWRGQYPVDGRPGARAPVEEMRAALARAHESARRGVHHDVHCWVFTPAGFVSIMADLADLDMLGFACTEIHRTEPGEIDFFVHMMRSDDRSSILDSWRWAAWKVAEDDAKTTCAVS